MLLTGTLTDSAIGANLNAKIRDFMAVAAHCVSTFVGRNLALCLIYCHLSRHSFVRSSPFPTENVSKKKWSGKEVLNFVARLT